MTKRLLLAAIAAATLVAPAIAADSISLSHFLEQWDGNNDGVVTLAEIKQGREHRFYAFDANADGYLDRDEYARFDKVRDAGIARFSAEEQVKIRQIADGLTLPRNDTDGDGRVSRAEFIDGSAAWMKAIDKDGDGQLTSATSRTNTCASVPAREPRRGDRRSSSGRLARHDVMGVAVAAECARGLDLEAGLRNRGPKLLRHQRFDRRHPADPLQHRDHAPA